MGFAEAFAAIESAWSLQAAGFTVAAFRREGSRPALRRVRGVTLHSVPAPEHDARATVTAVRDLARVLGAAVLLPLDDHALWVCSQLGDIGAHLAGPTGDSAECALDKGIQLGAAERAGLPVPPTKVVHDLAGIAPFETPVMIKPARALYEVDGRLERPTGVVSSGAQEFRRAAARPWHPPLLIQPLIGGRGEGIFGHAGPRGIAGWSAHRRVRMVNPQGSASAACRSIPVDPGLMAATERFIESIGWQGLFMLEFLRDANGEPWFMELNGRAWGSMALARRRGFEYPAWTVRAALDPDFEPVAPADPPEILCRNLGLELAHLMFVTRGPQSDAPIEWPRLSRAVRDVCRHQAGSQLYNWNPSQPDVLLADTLGTLDHYVRRIGRKSG